MFAVICKPIKSDFTLSEVFMRMLAIADMAAGSFL